MTLSVIVITKDEEAVIRRCIESVAWADEIIVVDSGSTDRTRDICAELGARVHVADWHGPATQRNRAIDLVSKDWVLALDADEWVSADLRHEIEETLRAPGDKVVFKMPRLSSYCGRDMHHGGWWPDHVSRLFKHGTAWFGGGIVHDHLIAEGPVGTLKKHLSHEAFTDLDEVLQKLNSYSTWGAQTLNERGVRGGLIKALAHGAWTFLRTYVIRAGFLDGREGFMLAISNAEGTYYKYAKLMQLQQHQERRGKGER